MDIALGFLTFGTLGFVMVFAFLSACLAEKQRKEGTEKSSLARRTVARQPVAR